MADAGPRLTSCEYWQRRMFAKFREKNLSHVTCGRPWAEHGEMGECSPPDSQWEEQSAEATQEWVDRPSCDRCGGWLDWCKGKCP